MTRLGDLLDFGNFLKPLATIILPKSHAFLGNSCKGAKIFNFFQWNHFWATLIDIWRFFSGHSVSRSVIPLQSKWVFSASPYGERSLKWLSKSKLGCGKDHLRVRLVSLGQAPAFPRNRSLHRREDVGRAAAGQSQRRAGGLCNGLVRQFHDVVFYSLFFSTHLTNHNIVNRRKMNCNQTIKVGEKA